jgi:hypothetical protein
MKATSFRLPESTLNDLNALAKKLDLTLTQAVILAIDRMVGGEREQRRPPEVRSDAAPEGVLEGNTAPRRYPRWKYHPTERPRLVQNAEEEAALAPRGWIR